MNFSKSDLISFGSILVTTFLLLLHQVDDTFATFPSLRFEKYCANCKIIFEETPFQNNEVASTTQCFSDCTRNRHRCAYVALIPPVPGAGPGSWICSLYSLVTDFANSLSTPGFEVHLYKVVMKSVNCQTWLEHGHTTDGIYDMTVERQTFPARCFMSLSSEPAEGWTEIQNREDGTVSFDQDWAQYKNGFGDVNGTFWLGNEKVHLMTNGSDNQGHPWQIKLIATTFSGVSTEVEFTGFQVVNETNKYALTTGVYHKGKK